MVSRFGSGYLFSPTLHKVKQLPSQFCSHLPFPLESQETDTMLFLSKRFALHIVDANSFLRPLLYFLGSTLLLSCILWIYQKHILFNYYLLYMFLKFPQNALVV